MTDIVERLQAENDRLIHDIQAPDGYSWEWHCARKDEEIERLRGLLREYADVVRLVREGKPVPLSYLEDRIREALGDE